MKAISLKQPWANLVASGKKTIETRKWSTNYRGDLVICSSQNPKIEPYGKALCIVELYDIKPMEKKHEKKACMKLPRAKARYIFSPDFAGSGIPPKRELPRRGIKVYPKAHAWFLRNLRPIDPPISVKGSLGIFNLELHLDHKIVN
jgi:hypothetical protein